MKHQYMQHFLKTGHFLKTAYVIGALSMTFSLSAAAEGFQTLLRGESGLDSFTIIGDANWAPKDGAIEASNGSASSFLVSNESYEDFSLVVEFWASDDANSGIFLRCQQPDNITDLNCYEANIFDQRPDPSYSTGSIVHVASASTPSITAGGQWNTYEITLSGNRLLVKLNGQVTVDVEDGQFRRGPIALQWGKGTIRFRKVTVVSS